MHNSQERRNSLSRKEPVLMIVMALFLTTVFSVASGDEPENGHRFVDCSLIVGPEYPASWPSAPFPRFRMTHERTIGPDSAYNIDVLLIDGNTGTQLDVPPHSVARPPMWILKIEQVAIGEEAPS